jgi:hypothetical protein
MDLCHAVPDLQRDKPLAGQPAAER